MSRPQMNLVRVLGSPRVRDPAVFPSEMSDRQHDLSSPLGKKARRRTSKERATSLSDRQHDLSGGHVLM